MKAECKKKCFFLYVQTLISDLLKVIFFARSEFSLIKFCAELCTKTAIKTCKIWKNLGKLYQKYEKVPVLQVPRSKI